MKIVNEPVKQWARKKICRCAGFLQRQNLDVSYIIEPKDWAIKSEGLNIVREARSSYNYLSIDISDKPYMVNTNIMHFGSQFMFQNWLNCLSENSRIVVTYFHGKMGESKSIDDNLSFLVNNQDSVQKVIVSFQGMADRLKNYGVKPNLIVKIPVGVSTKLFTPSSNIFDSNKTKEKLKIPSDVLVIGSFQKDGLGWGRGMKPKNIKGPDILVDTLRQIAKKVKIHVLLTGPSRGYVKMKLREFGIDFSHVYAKSESEIVHLYQILDLYLVTSRDEGGPKGLIEALSTGCPVVTTPVGMATDLEFINEFYAKTLSFESEEIAHEALAILKKQIVYEDKLILRSNALVFDWKIIANKHMSEVYNPILSER